MREIFEDDVVKALDVLNKGGVILYPTDTVWGIGCDATNADAISRVYKIKQREEQKSLIILVADERDVLQYVAAPDLGVFDFLNEQTRPTTVIFDNAVSLPDNLIAHDGSIAIRIVQDEFCRHLVKRLRKPIVSTSANISGSPAPVSFAGISDKIKNTVDYIVTWKQDEIKPSQPSQVVKYNSNGTISYIRN